MAEKPPIPATTVSFGGFEAEGDKVVLRFYFLHDYRTVGEMSYEVPAGPKERSRRLIRAHEQIARSLEELQHVNAAMLASVKRAEEE